jgi:hypothetical protein
MAKCPARKKEFDRQRKPGNMASSRFKPTRVNARQTLENTQETISIVSHSRKQRMADGESHRQIEDTSIRVFY